MRILVTLPAFTPAAAEILQQSAELRFVPSDREAVRSEISGCDAAVIGLGVKFDRELLSSAHKLACIATATTGLDHIDLEAARERGVQVLSLRGEDTLLGTITGTAELALGLLLALVRGIPQAHQSVVHHGEWNRERFRGSSISGRTVGIVGLGRLGRQFAKMIQGLRANVCYFDPYVPAQMHPDFKKVEFGELLETSFAISIHTHLTEDTARMFGAPALARMKRGTYLVNTARGGIVDEMALLFALQSGQVGGYATDVLDGEINFEKGGAGEHPIVAYARSNPNVVVTPHIGGMTQDSREATDLFIAQKLHALISGAAFAYGSHR